MEEVDALTARLGDLARQHYSPLTSVCGVNLLTAGMLRRRGPGAFRGLSHVRTVRRERRRPVSRQVA